MCGLAGFIGSQDCGEDYLSGQILSMTDSLLHRGPDDFGVWTDSEFGLALGHRRLSILDLSSAGRQPMLSKSQRFIMIFNGEIYNHRELRERLALDGVRTSWVGSSDTETLLECFDNWGIQKTLHFIDGMFSVVIWDRLGKQLTLIRDRLGEKPLYFGWVGSVFVFASELKALRRFANFNNSISRDALVLYFGFTYIPAPHTIYNGVFKLEPGCLAIIDGVPPTSAPLRPLKAGDEYGTLSIKTWWSAKEMVECSRSHRVMSQDSLLLELEDHLINAVETRIISDVPIGVFLSGGIDSSLVSALLKKKLGSSLKTFSVGFNEKNFNELPQALAVAEYLNTEHYSSVITPDIAKSVISRLSDVYDEPFSDSSQIATYIVSDLASRHVKVVLGGDGGDELFGGYNRYFWNANIWRRFKIIPFGLRRFMGYFLKSIPSFILVMVGSFLSSKFKDRHFRDIVHSLADRLLNVKTDDDLYRSLVSEWKDPFSLVQGFERADRFESLHIGQNLVPNFGSNESELAMMFKDFVNYLPDDILCKVDRASMACGLEVRSPYLDRMLVEFAWRLPLNMKICGKVGKWALRQVLYKYIPRELVDRPKMGFGVPIGEWLRGPLRDWADNLLDEDRIISEGYLNVVPIRKAWDEHLRGERDHTARLWSVLMFESWLECNSKVT